MPTERSAGWNPELYESCFSFVWKHGSSLMDLLDPKPGETILDLGCGTGQLTAELASRGAVVTGLDSSPGMVAQARINYPNIRFLLADGADFTLPAPVDAVFSNAALHWIVRASDVIACVRRALKPGGRFVAEFGGKHNVETIIEAVKAEVPGAVSPWYYPSLAEYAGLLESSGFRVVEAYHFDRPTPLEGSKGMEDWLEMFGQKLLATVEPSSAAAVRRRIAERLRPKLCKDGQWTADYVRLRIRAIAQP